MGETRAVLTTVVVAVGDEPAARGLIEAVRSLRTQEIPLRIMVVNNAAPVALPVLPGVSVVRARERLTAGAARNLGLARVSTPIVVFLDAKDVMPPEVLAQCQAAMIADPELLACVTVAPGGLARGGRLLAMLHTVWPVSWGAGPSIMRTEAVRAVGGYDDEASDWSLLVALGFRGKLGRTDPSGARPAAVAPPSPHRAPLRAQLRGAAAVRARLRRDTGTPSWIRSLVPLIQLGQYAALFGHELITATRRLKETRR